jgi:hypothetical protein
MFSMIIMDKGKLEKHILYDDIVLFYYKVYTYNPVSALINGLLH